MDKQSVQTVISVLNQHQVRYLIAGGLAVVAHGYVRFTADVDLILSLEEQNLVVAVTALKSLHYRPRAPVAIELFIDPANREQWKREKGLTVFSLFSPLHPATEIDLFAEAPLDFAAAYARGVRLEIAPGVTGMFCGLDDLIVLKSQAARPQDLQDIQQLRSIKGKTAHE